MGKTLQYVKEFDFGPAKVQVSAYCRGGPVKKAAGGVVVEKATGEKHPSRSAMVKHERSETPRVQREEILQRAKVVAPRKGAPVAPLAALKKVVGSK